MIRRAGKVGSFDMKVLWFYLFQTCFNYGFIGGRGVGKSSLIDAMRGMSSKNPLSATKINVKRTL